MDSGKSLDYFLHGQEYLSLVTLTGKSLAKIHNEPYFLPEKQTCREALQQLWQEHGMVTALIQSSRNVLVIVFFV
ncbi:hypothetical protein ACLB1Q_36635 [Escherichia coli]